MRQFIVAGNWKMHGTRSSVAELTQQLAQADIKQSSSFKALVFPPFIYLPQVAEILSTTDFQWGGQNLDTHQQGAYTGEISGMMLAEAGCRYVIVGHSERRMYYAESHEIVAKKVQAAQAAGLMPILCVGETLPEREQGKASQVVCAQLNAVLDLANGSELLNNVVIAYEPVWAIGTGLTAAPEQAQEMHADIRRHIAQHSAEIAQKIAILYGGSVKAANAATLFAMPDIDGALVGGASLIADEFIAICKAAQTAEN